MIFEHVFLYTKCPKLKDLLHYAAMLVLFQIHIFILFRQTLPSSVPLQGKMKTYRRPVKPPSSYDIPGLRPAAG